MTTNKRPTQGDDPPFVVTIAELQQRLRSSKTRCYEWIKNNDIRVIKLGRKTLVLWASVEEMIERNIVRIGKR